MTRDWAIGEALHAPVLTCQKVVCAEVVALKHKEDPFIPKAFRVNSFEKDVFMHVV